MAVLLGIDGGGTGCRAAVADASGRILGTGTAGPANIASDLDAARDNILAATRAALAEAGARTAIGDLAAGLGLAGANARGKADALRHVLPFARVRIETDAVAAVKGALGQADGIVAALGTGSVFASQRGGYMRQIGGWGLVLGDEGSGAWLGRALLRECLRAAEGFRTTTPLLQAVLAEQGGVDAVIAVSLAARPADLAALAPRVLTSDDPAAHELRARALADVNQAIGLLQGEATLPVSVIGGLAGFYTGQLAARWDLRAPLGTALDGALVLAREGT